MVRLWLPLPEPRALPGLPLNVASIAGDGRDAIDELLDDGGRGTGLLIQRELLRDAVGAVSEGNLGGNLGGGVSKPGGQTAGNSPSFHLNTTGPGPPRPGRGPAGAG